MKFLEICIDNIESINAAQYNGADRIELCRDLSVGGLTPTPGFVKVIEELAEIPIFVLIRPRPGNFCYNDKEVVQMIEDIYVLKTYGICGFVFGAVTEDKEVDISVCQQLLSAARPYSCTFHRAFDELKDKDRELESIIALGFKRVLTTGGSDTAFEGIQDLEKLVSQAKNRIIIMPGGNINDENISDIMNGTKAKEFHSSGRRVEPDSKLKSRCCDPNMVYTMCEILNPNLIPCNKFIPRYPTIF